MRAMLFPLSVLGVVCIGFVVTVCPAAHAQTPRLELTVVPGSAEAGASAKVPIQFNSPVGVGAVQFELVFDPAALKFKGVENGPHLPAGLVEANEVQPGRVRVALVSNEEVKGAGVLLLAEFELTPGPVGATSVNLESVRAWDLANNLPLLIAARAGEWARAAAATQAGSGAGAPAGSEISPWVYGLGGLAVLAAAILVFVALRRK